jgi:hypothetical protein
MCYIAILNLSFLKSNLSLPENTFFINLFSPDGLDFKKVEAVRMRLSFHEMVLSVQNKLDVEE